MLKNKIYLDKTIKFLKKDLNSFLKEDILNLQNIIKYHSDLYYNKENPIISDRDYDKLFSKLQKLEERFKNKLNLFVTKQVGAKLKESSFKKVKHSRTMISLDNTYDEKDLLDFDKRVKKNIKDKTNFKYTIEFKFDGLGIELIYKKGKLVQAITRGDGIRGEDVTENIMQIDNIPKTIIYKETLEVRGEVVMPISSFNKLNKIAKKNKAKIFSNPRNAASGSIRIKDNRITKERNLKFFAYDLANFEEFSLKENKFSYFDIIKTLEKLGFDISSYFEVCTDIKKVIKKIENFGDLKKKLDFEIDGLVIKVNNIDLWKIIGSTEHHPKYAIAYKFPAEIFTTKILNVEHQVGKTGTITPVANLEKVNIGGAIIKRATLHNYEEIEKLGIAIGDYVFIKRAGEVIPKIIALAEKGLNRKQIKLPSKCPSCGKEVKKTSDKVRYFCDNKNCKAQIIEKLIYAVGKSGFNIDGFGEKQVKRFFKLGFIKNLNDIFEIEKYKKDILNLEGFQEKSVNNIIESLEKAKKVDITILINSLSIAGVGKKTSKTLAKLFKSENDLLNFKYSIEDIEKLPDIGSEIARNVFNFFKMQENKETLEKLVKLLDIEYFKEKVFNKGNYFFGKKVCITGSFNLEDGKKIKRDDLIKKLEQVGGEFISSISKNTDYLLAGEKAGSKLKKANNLGIKIISLDEFLDKI